MADLNLKTTYQDDVLDTTVNTQRKFNMIQNDDGTVSFEDVTTYLQVGDSFGALDINTITGAVNQATETASNAVSAASTAQSTASTAKTNAANAQTTANNAYNLAASKSNVLALQTKTVSFSQGAYQHGWATLNVALSGYTPIAITYAYTNLGHKELISGTLLRDNIAYIYINNYSSSEAVSGTVEFGILYVKN